MVMAAINTRPIRGSLIDDPEALDVFSGPYTRKDSYVSMLEANGVTKAEPVDNDPVSGGGEAHSILTNSFYLGLHAPEEGRPGDYRLCALGACL